jgi:acetylornithine deacetylase/succinyl-diaminopimelate desuccinylase-like protein
VQARQDIRRLLESRLTLTSPDGWQSSLAFPFIQVGTPGVYNITPGEGLLGVEVRPIPQDDLQAVQRDLQKYCDQQELELRFGVMEGGVACSPDNPYLAALLDAVRSCSGQEPRIGRKLPGTSARFAPGGQGVVWGQTGLGPHSAAERHYIPSILPYYQALQEFGLRLTQYFVDKTPGA